MDRSLGRVTELFCMSLLLAAGCASPYYADRDALVGGVGGAGIGALAGSAMGHPLVGAAVGAGVGTMAGAAVGSERDAAEARNRAMIAAQMGRPVPVGAASVDQVIAMTRSGVSEELIIGHIQRNGMAMALQPNDLIVLKQQGVSDRVVAVMQATPMPAPPVPPAYAAAGLRPAGPGGVRSELSAGVLLSARALLPPGPELGCFREQLSGVRHVCRRTAGG